MRGVGCGCREPGVGEGRGRVLGVTAGQGGSIPQLLGRCGRCVMCVVCCVLLGKVIVGSTYAVAAQSDTHQSIEAKECVVWLLSCGLG